MPLYNPPLRLSRKEEWNTASKILNALEGFKLDYFYTGKRIGKNLIELQVCTIIEDSGDNIFLRSCDYSGNKDKWKEVILNQIQNQLRVLGVDEGFVKAETRYLEVENAKHLPADSFENQKREFLHKVKSKKE